MPARTWHRRHGAMTGPAGGVAEALRQSVAVNGTTDLRAFLGPLARGSGDPTMRVASGAAIRASVTANGPATIELRVSGGAVHGAFA